MRWRILLLAKAGTVGRIVSVDATCTGMSGFRSHCTDGDAVQGAMDYWAPTAVLPIVQLLGDSFASESYVSFTDAAQKGVDMFVRGSFEYPNAVASFKVGRTVKSEGELIISGTEGYIYVPAPWWKTDYFEVRRENPDNNRRYFFQLDGEGIRNQLAAFSRAVERGARMPGVTLDESIAIARIFEHFCCARFTKTIN